MWRRGKHYYVSAGPTCCYCTVGSRTDIYAATSPLGPFTKLGVLVQRNQSRAQQNWVFQTAAGQWVWAGNRWGSSPDGAFAHDLQTWLPMTWDDTRDPPRPREMNWTETFEMYA